MDFATIDRAIESYSGLLAEDDCVRLGFFRGLWELQQQLQQQAAVTVGQLPDFATIEPWYWQERPLLMMAPLTLDSVLLADAAQQVSAYLAAHAGLSEVAAQQLATFDWQGFLAEQDIAQAGYDPLAFIESCCRALGLGAVGDSPPTELAAMALAMALRPLLQPVATAVMDGLDLKQASAEHKKPLRCPICGSLAAAACVGEVPSGAKNGRLLYCATCGANWEFERIRCARCGSQNQEKLHYFHLDGDSAHRLQLCDACGDYLRVSFRAELPAAFAFEVEDVVMAKLDKIAQEKRSLS